MAGELKGNALTVGISDDGGSSYTVIAGCREKSFSTEIGEIDITNDDSNEFRTLLEGGIKSATISVSGIMKDRDLLEKLLSGTTIYPIQVTWVGSGAVTDAKIEGNFQIANVSKSGNYDSEAQSFEAELRNSGAFTFTKASDT